MSTTALISGGVNPVASYYVFMSELLTISLNIKSIEGGKKV